MKISNKPFNELIFELTASNLERQGCIQYNQKRQKIRALEILIPPMQTFLKGFYKKINF